MRELDNSLGDIDRGEVTVRRLSEQSVLVTSRRVKSAPWGGYPLAGRALMRPSFTACMPPLAPPLAIAVVVRSQPGGPRRQVQHAAGR